MNTTCKITPVRAFAEDADYLAITPAGFGATPSFVVLIGKFTPGTAAVGVPGHAGYAPAVEDKLDVHKHVTVTLTPAQWNAWPADADDAAYIRACVLEQLGYTAA